jgi:hypothetical protein
MEKNKHTKYFYNFENVFLAERCHILGRYINTVKIKRRELKSKYKVALRRVRIIPHRTLIGWFFFYFFNRHYSP